MIFEKIKFCLRIWPFSHNQLIELRETIDQLIISKQPLSTCQLCNQPAYCLTVNKDGYDACSDCLSLSRKEADHVQTRRPGQHLQSQRELLAHIDTV